MIDIDRDNFVFYALLLLIKELLGITGTEQLISSGFFFIVMFTDDPFTTDKLNLEPVGFEISTKLLDC